MFIENINCKDQGANVKQSGKITWAADGSTGSGFMTFTVSQPGFDPCTSTYEVTGVRL